MQGLSVRITHGRYKTLPLNEDGVVGSFLVQTREIHFRIHASDGRPILLGLLPTVVDSGVEYNVWNSPEQQAADAAAARLLTPLPAAAPVAAVDDEAGAGPAVQSPYVPIVHPLSAAPTLWASTL